jgi:hypothetical protein
LLEDQLRETENIFDYEEIKRRKKRVEEVIEKASDPNAVPSTWLGLSRLSQRGVRFIRWLRNNLFIGACWELAVEGLRRRYALK